MMYDFHVHSNYSDGTDGVLEIANKANSINLTYLSITDHNTIDAYFDKNLNCYLGKIITGVELTTTFNGEIIEILGYNFDIYKMKDLLDKHVLKFEEKQILEFEIIINAYSKLGILLEKENIKFNPKKESCKKYVLNEIIKYDYNDKFFYNLNSKNSSKLFRRNEVYNPKSKLFVDQTSLYPSLSKVVEIIHSCGGVAILAHIFEYSNSNSLFNNLEEFISMYDIDGIECVYPTFSTLEISELVRFCESKNLIITGGSDYHGNKRAVSLGDISSDKSNNIEYNKLITLIDYIE